MSAILAPATAATEASPMTDGFRLVIGGVAKRHAPHAPRFRPIGDQLGAGLPGLIHQIAADHAVIPAQGLMRNFQIGAKPRNARGLCG